MTHADRRQVSALDASSAGQGVRLVDEALECRVQRLLGVCPGADAGAAGADRAEVAVLAHDALLGPVDERDHQESERHHR